MSTHCTVPPPYITDTCYDFRTQELLAARFTKLSEASTDEKRLSSRTEDTDVESLPKNHTVTGRLSRLHGTAPPFIPAHDFARGAMYAGQAALSYALMLAVM